MNRIANLRAKIRLRSDELNIQTAHDSAGHWYRYQDQLYPSVTEKLSILKDKGLMNWKMNRALEWLKENADMDPFAQMPGKPLYELNDEHFEKAKLAPQQDFESAGDIGKATHDWRQGWFQEWIDTSVSIVPPVKDPRSEVISSAKAIENCISKLRAEPLACEFYLADLKLKLGGTGDDLWAVPIPYDVPDNSLGEGGKKLKVKWETWLVDLKTSNIGNKNSYYMQVATYWHMFKKLYKIKIDKVFILHTSKTRFGEYNLIPLKHPQRYFQMAKAAYKLYDDLEELEQLKQPEIAKI